jgi:hypothetical protein
MTPEEVNQMAQKREIRAFADRGTWRFRTQDVEEKARQLGRGSSPDLQLGDAPKAKPHDSPAPATRQAGEGDVFSFPLGADDEVELGSEVGRAAGGSSRIRGPKSPPPKPGSDSDVRLVSEGSDVKFKAVSDVRAAGEPGSGSQVRKKEPAPGLKPKSDSDVKLVQEQTPGDSSIPIGSQPPKSGTDSDIRLEESGAGSGSGVKSGPDDLLLTEEIDLDSELAQAEEATRAKQKKPKTPHQPMDLTSPYQIQGDVPAAGESKERAPDSSSDFSLTPHRDDADSSSPLSLSSDEHPVVKAPDSDIDLGGPAKPVGGVASDSGISLQVPGDSGISLERSPGSSDEIEFELSLDEGSTPKPASKPAVKEDDSSSEFELTLDDSGGLAPLESDEKPAKPAPAKAKKGEGGEKDIFETDFDVPALEDESGSQAVALDESDTDLESSDFDLALGDEDIGTEEESGSQVVVLEDEEADEGAATVARTSRRPAAAQNLMDDDSSAETEALPEEGEEAYAEDEEELPPRRVAAADADWGILPGAVMIPCVIVMLFACVMGFELLRSMWSYRQPSKAGTAIVRFFADTFGAELPKD